ncbi:hypothetical protein GGR57DRAFT_471163 [Xylariaceae sp. FL1272]|nr:hypothetical protein GGR57DRAFT_471163 [Xylariaceae sp. FL1272]
MDRYSPDTQMFDEYMMSGGLDVNIHQYERTQSSYHRSPNEGFTQRPRPVTSIDDSDDSDDNDASRRIYSSRSEVSSATNKSPRTAASSTTESFPRSISSTLETPPVPRAFAARRPRSPVKLRPYRLAAAYPLSCNRPQITGSPRVNSASPQDSPSRRPSRPPSKGSPGPPSPPKVRFEEPPSPPASYPPPLPENPGPGGSPPPRRPSPKRRWPGGPPFHSFNFHQNMSSSAPRNPSLIRDRPVIVILRPGARGYICNRADIIEHLPNTRSTPFGRTFCPQIAYRNMGPSVLEALDSLFSGLERYRATGDPLYLFENARHWLFNENTRAFPQCYEFFIGACNALDSEYGLGCSDALLQQIDEFALDLMYSHDFGHFNRQRLLIFFMAYAKVFQPSTQRHMDTLRELYNSVPVQIRSGLVAQLAGYLDVRSQRSNPNVMFRAMRDMSMA